MTYVSVVMSLTFGVMCLKSELRGETRRLLMSPTFSERHELSSFHHLWASDWNASLIVQLIHVLSELITSPGVKGHVSHRRISAAHVPPALFASLSDDVIVRDFLNTGFIHRGLFPTRGRAPNKPFPWQLQPPGMWEPFLMLLCGRNVRMRACALHGHVYACKQRSVLRFLAFIFSVSDSKNDESLVVVVFILVLMSTNNK